MTFTREELQEIRERARKVANNITLDIFWQVAYSELGLAADHLDAMIARSTTSTDPVDHPVPVRPELTAKELNDRMVAEAKAARDGLPTTEELEEIGKSALRAALGPAGKMCGECFWAIATDDPKWAAHQYEEHRRTRHGGGA